MKRKITNKEKVLASFLVLLIMAVISDLSQDKAIKNGIIERDKIGGEEKEISLTLDVENVFKEEEYKLEVSPVQPTEDVAREYIKDAIATIDQDFQEVGERVPLQKDYKEGAVEADWLFEPYGLIDEKGDIRFEKVEDGGTTINAQVELTCGSYEEIYCFSFLIIPRVLSLEEEIWQQIEEWMERQMLLEGTTNLQLPTEINGYKVRWSEEREYLTPQILLLELVAIVLLWFASKRKQIEEEQRRIRQMEREYPEIVNQISLLLGAGMTTRQAWNKLATQYSFKRTAGMIEKKEVYEAIARMNRRFSEGESERVIYQQFSEEIPALCFHQLTRILLGNLEKGTQGISRRLEEEARVAYEQRIQQAKKLGEEASTKMLFPLMLMLVLVMGIVMLPALIEFQI